MQVKSKQSKEAWKLTTVHDDDTDTLCIRWRDETEGKIDQRQLE